jgi:signal peptidase I
MNYGTRLLKIRKYFHENKIEYIRLKGWGNIKRGDVVVFNFPNLQSLSDSSPNVYGDCIVKRCYGTPGDTVIIKNNESNNEKIVKPEKQENLFPHDTALHWTIINYGSLFVPGKGYTMKMTVPNADHYKDVLMYEGYKTEILRDSVFLNNVYTSNYTFKYNYYFMKGDNFFDSMDSRYWGFVPENHIIGKAVIILFSKGEVGFNWKRVLKRIR